VYVFGSRATGKAVDLNNITKEFKSVIANDLVCLI
jgi:predicted nucleotidyltransferase